MTTDNKMPIWKRAALRGAGASALLFASLEGLILVGKTTKLDTGEAAFIALVSGFGYAALWSVFAMMTDRMLARINAAAKADDRK